jgi:hypothetical protein
MGNHLWQKLQQDTGLAVKCAGAGVLQAPVRACVVVFEEAPPLSRIIQLATGLYTF